MNGSSGQVSRQGILLAEYREAMESQRANTNLIYSWTGNIVLVLSTGLFVYGATTEAAKVFVAIMLLAWVLMVVWCGMTPTFVFYIRQRMRRIHEIESELGMRLMSEAGKEIVSLGPKGRFLEARTYVRGFAALYFILWLVTAGLKFCIP